MDLRHVLESITNALREGGATQITSKVTSTSKSTCYVFSTEPMVCPLCGATVAACVEHFCTRAGKSKRAV